MLNALSTSPAAYAKCAPLMDDMSDSTFASPILDRLLEGGVIDKAIYEVARDKLREQGAEPFSTLGGGLDWLEEEEVLSFEQMVEIEAKADADEGFASNAVRRQALDEYSQDLELELALLQRQKATPWREKLAWGLGGAALLGAAGWYFLTPPLVPRCEASVVKKSIHASLWSAQAHQMSRKPSASASEAGNLRNLKLEQVKELGYIEAERARGCVAMLVVDEERTPIAYEVKGKGDDIYVMGSDERLLRTRYAQLDSDGALPELGKPLGREGMRQALQQGVIDFSKLGGSVADALARMQGEVGRPESALGEVLPLNDCTQGAGGVWRCKLMLQYRDSFMIAIGKENRLLLEGEFSFVQDGKDWRPADNFKKQFATALVQSRLMVMKGLSREQVSGMTIGEPKGS
ncbi:hypothetical protein HNO92_000587 [Chromobacterium alkanivorans]|uniref:hypothetical protein n=2 Tax=Chromobacterium alkanivorans TaxID=1071719 RepID=UPI002166D4BC|nr:hypothetical protein [Chromobacterium alkanivorans]MCS3802937.1 hypothetical protein [Chromobacterium alkanivorans]MCS3817263.1 hypothetical protein [Chromobacterium alkanivorans]MCS3872303.1 hypothetical protein [Chromobacterium alkanivorans]